MSDVRTSTKGICFEFVGELQQDIEPVASIQKGHVQLLFITLGAHAQPGYGSWVCVSVCYSISHFSGVFSSHKGYDLLNGQ